MLMQDISTLDYGMHACKTDVNKHSEAEENNSVRLELAQQEENFACSILIKNILAPG
jgi:hypothetical protein